MSRLAHAITAQDHTFYPFATTNRTDYDNLRSVYLDSTLNPLLRELDFRQEGWRLEHMDPRDKSTPIIFKGIVFNEMKGVMSDAGSLYWEEFQKHMYNDTIYGFNSGGNPLDIPSLSYDRLKSFHAQHYHPSNAKTYTYGIFCPYFVFLYLKNMDLCRRHLSDRPITGARSTIQPILSHFDRELLNISPTVYISEACRNNLSLRPSNGSN